MNAKRPFQSGPAGEPFLVVKLGGSLLAAPKFLTLLQVLRTRGPGARAVVVPGGGPLADSVRRLDRQLGLGAGTAHWMAILAMDQLAWLLADKAVGAAVVTTPGEIESAFRRGLLPVLAPSAWLRAADPLPHSWAVTGDSIAAWVAAALGAPALLLLKSLPGEPRTLARGVGGGAVDGYFWRAVPPALPVWVADGRDPPAVAELLERFSLGVFP